MAISTKTANNGLDQRDDRLGSSSIMSLKRRFSCPLTKSIMEDPVSTPCCEANFERKALQKWMQKQCDECPECGASIAPSDLTPNAALQWEILYLERKSGKETNTDFTCSSRSQPPPPPPEKKDSPPLLPRSPAALKARKIQIRNTKGKIKSKSSTIAAPKTKMDLPPMRPRSLGCLSARKRVDSAPAVPRRKSACSRTVPDSDCIRNCHSSTGCSGKYLSLSRIDHDSLFGILSSHLSVARDESLASLSIPRNDSILSVLDDVLAILSEDDDYF